MNSNVLNEYIFKQVPIINIFLYLGDNDSVLFQNNIKYYFLVLVVICYFIIN